MKTNRNDIVTWMFVALYFVLMIGAGYFSRRFPLIPPVVLVLTSTFVYLVGTRHFDKLSLNESLSVVHMLSFFNFCAGIIPIVVRLKIYTGLLSEPIVDGKWLQRQVKVQSEDGYNSWFEVKKYFEPSSATGERVQDFVEILILAICALVIWLWIKSYIKLKKMGAIDE